jgi:hypothetical protein
MYGHNITTQTLFTHCTHWQQQSHLTFTVTIIHLNDPNFTKKGPNLNATSIQSPSSDK